MTIGMVQNINFLVVKYRKKQANCYNEALVIPTSDDGFGLVVEHMYIKA